MNWFMLANELIQHSRNTPIATAVNTNSSHFIISKNNTVWHAVSSRFKPDKELASSVLLERKDVLFKTQS